MISAVFCADTNPWDASLLCELLTGHHDQRHQAHGCIRWTDACHFPGDDCGPFAHSSRPTTQETAA